MPEEWQTQSGRAPMAMLPSSEVSRADAVMGRFLCEVCEAPRFEREFRDGVIARGYGCGRICKSCEWMRSCMGCRKVKAKRHFTMWRWDDSQERRCNDCIGHSERELGARRHKEKVRRAKAEKEKGS